MDNREKGTRGEALALQLLENLGYTLLCKNARFGHDEIDLIMLDGEVTVFAEVKARSSGEFGTGREAVDIRKQQRMTRAAQAYLLGLEVPARFDVIEVDLRTKEISHIINAFMAQM